MALGATARVAARLLAGRMPEAMVHERRSVARKNAKKKGYSPAPAHLPLMAWHLLMTNVPPTIWPSATLMPVSPLRWPGNPPRLATNPGTSVPACQAPQRLLRQARSRSAARAKDERRHPGVSSVLT